MILDSADLVVTRLVRKGEQWGTFGREGGGEGALRTGKQVAELDKNKIEEKFLLDVSNSYKQNLL